MLTLIPLDSVDLINTDENDLQVQFKEATI